MTQSIARQPALELALRYWIEAQEKERSPLTLEELGGPHRLLFSSSLNPVATTRTDFQLSRRWFKFRTEDLGIAAVQTAFEGAYVNTRD